MTLERQYSYPADRQDGPPPWILDEHNETRADVEFRATPQMPMRVIWVVVSGGGGPVEIAPGGEPLDAGFVQDPSLSDGQCAWFRIVTAFLDDVRVPAGQVVRLRMRHCTERTRVDLCGAAPA